MMINEIVDKAIEIVKKDFLSSVDQKIISLKELQPHSTCKEIIIKSKTNLVAFKFDFNLKIDDTFVDKFPFFKNLTDRKNCHRKICDYIIFHKESNRLNVVVCELKSNTKSGAIAQIVSGKLFIEYVLKTVLRCLGKENTIRINYKYLLFSNDVGKLNYQNYKFAGDTYTIYEYLCGFEYHIESFVNL